MDKAQVMSTLNCSIDNNFNIDTSATSDAGTLYIENGNNLTCWDYYHQYYYPEVIYRDYPVYIREKALDKGKQAFEIIKILKDKKLVQLKKVSDFIDLMDALIKIL